MKNLKSKKGITLISLVITVIVILILAVVAVSLITQKDSVFNAAQDAGNKYNAEASEEQNVLASLGNKVAAAAGTSDNAALLEIIAKLENRIEALEQGNAGALSVYPVGSIYISVNSTNPGDIFGGTWEAYGAGRTIVGVGTVTDANNTQQEFTANETGGELRHTLTTAEMPRHSHTLTAVTGTSTTQAVYFYNSNYKNVGVLYAANSQSYIQWSTPYSVRDVLSSATTAQSTTNEAGESSAHNNIQPYITAYMWKRVA